MLNSFNNFQKISMTPGDQKHIMEVSLFESGEVILKIWDDEVYNFKEDYIKFHVEHLIYPNKVSKHKCFQLLYCIHASVLFKYKLCNVYGLNLKMIKFYINSNFKNW